MPRVVKKVNTTDSFKFEARSTSYSPLNAYWLARCSEEVYNPGRKAKNVLLKEWGLDKFNFMSRRSTQAFVASTKNYVIIAFRGTEPKKVQDIITDIDMPQVKAYGGKVHEGFKKAYHLVRSRLHKQLKAHGAAKKSIFITGHSLGAALATLCAKDLSERKIKVNGIYTFGQPRVGNETFVTNYNKVYGKKHFRITHVDDPIQHLPFKDLELKTAFGTAKLVYAHVDRKINVTNNNRLVMIYHPSKNVLNKIKSKAHISSHFMTGYLKAMKRNINHNPVTSKVQQLSEKDLIKIAAFEKKASDTLKSMNKEVTRLEKKTMKASQSVVKEANRAEDRVNKEIKRVGKKAGRFFGRFF